MASVMKAPTTMQVIELIAEMRTVCQKLRENGHRISFVPTMGALHIGHASLIKSAQARAAKTAAVKAADEKVQVSLRRQLSNGEKPPTQEALNSTAKTAEADRCKSGSVVVVSIFVNQKQFSNPNDFANYPNTLEADLELCRRLNVDYVFVPRASEIYPQNRSICTVLPPNSLADDLEGRSRPGHFAGMLTIVCKLFNIIRPHEAHFGDKDYQQLVLVSKMSEDLNLGVEVVAGETVRDPDMLPLSSRNVRLSARQRKAAPVMYRILADAKVAIESGMSQVEGAAATYLSSTILASMLTTLYLNLDSETLKTIDVDYLEVRCARDVTKVLFNHSLKAFDCQEGCVSRRTSKGESEDKILIARLLTSVIVGEVRLLDNIEVRLNENS